MSPWLKPRLLALVGVALIGGATYLHAQNDYGPPSKTPEEAAINFTKLLDAFRQSQQGRRQGFDPNFDPQRAQLLVGSIERDQFKALQARNAEKVMQTLADGAIAAPYDAKVQSSDGGQTVVQVAPSKAPRAREVVVVPEDGGYRVDIVATYGRWNNLAGIEADKALFRETGFLSPALARQPAYLGAATESQCQSNLKQLGFAIAQYTQDYDERMPPARRWIDATMPYTKSEELYRCPALPTLGNGYAMNQRASQQPLARFNSTAQTLLVYETSNLSRNVFGSFTGKAYRHTFQDMSSMNILFADGHVKRFTRGTQANITLEPSTTPAGLLTISMEGTR